MTEEMFEDDPRALTEQDNKRYIPKPYMDFFLALRYTADDDEIKTPAGVNADYRGYGQDKSSMACSLVLYVLRSQPFPKVLYVFSFL